MDSGADSCVAGKHAWIVEIVEGITVSAQGSNDSMPIDVNLPIVNVLYAYNHPDTGKVIILCMNHCIYLGDKKIDSIVCPNQMQLHGIYVDERPRTLFPGIDSAQTIVADEITMPLKLKRSLPYLPTRRPTLLQNFGYDSPAYRVDLVSWIGPLWRRLLLISKTPRQTSTSLPGF